jgi:hypothetical protein
MLVKKATLALLPEKVCLSAISEILLQPKMTCPK